MVWAPDYATLVEARAYITRHTDTVDDVEIALAVTAASRAVDRGTNRQFGVVAAAEERKYTARWDRRRCRWLVEVDDLMTLDGLTVTVEAGSVDTVVLEPINAAQESRPWETLVVDPDSTVKPTSDEHGVTVEALWGWTEVPDQIKQATLLQANRFVARRTSPFGIAGSPDLGSELRLLARLDPDVAVVLGPFIRWWGAA